jgi:5-methylcytosine-specific restriction endonuclease McrA
MSEPRVSAALRRAVAARAGHRCEYCGTREEFSASPFCVEHIMPHAGGGPTKSENLALACGGCNAHKGDKTKALDPAIGEHVPLFHPRKDAWDDHFAWSENTQLVVGLTSTGRATVQALRLNRTPLVNLRKLLLRAREHPPTADGE